MRAKSISENIKFERGKDPKKTLGIGLDSRRYVKSELEKKGFDIDSEGEFWDIFQEGFEDWSKEEIAEHIIYILNNGDPKFLMKYLNFELENYYQLKKDYGEMP